MRDTLQMHVVESKHNLMDNIYSLRFSEGRHFWKSIEKLTTFHDLRHNVVVVGIFDQINDSDDVRMRFFAKDWKFILEELDVYLLFLDLTLCHNLDCECLLGIFMHAKSHKAKCALTKPLTECIPWINILHFLELLVVSHRKLLFQSLLFDFP
mgnify:CR=1 FL=1|jgi:hypothetical protein